MLKVEPKLIYFPNKILNRKCRKVERISKKLEATLMCMAITMFAHKGLGLAAPQVGKAYRAIVIDRTAIDGSGGLLYLLNPEIIEYSEETDVREESCLSIPGLTVAVPRSVKITVRYKDRKGLYKRLEAEDLLARVIQHEVDHLNGILISDKSPIK